MWIPRDTEELVKAVQDGILTETETFDAKSQMDDNATETAKDIAAMANYGGVIIYGINEDDNKRLTHLTPVQLVNFEGKILGSVSFSNP